METEARLTNPRLLKEGLRAQQLAQDWENVEEKPRERPSTIAVIGLLIAFVGPELRELVHAHGLRAFEFGEAYYWALTVIMIAFVLAVERRPLSSIGLSAPTWRSLAWGAAAGLVVAFGTGVTYGVIFPILHLTINKSAMAQIMAMPYWLRLLLVLRAAVFEEVVYCGYMIERLSDLTGKRIWSGAIAWGAFTLVHIFYWGAAQMVVAGFAGLILTALYLWRRDLACNMVAHFFTDGLAFLVG